MKKPVYPCLWFDGQAKEAAKFYCDLFPNSKVIYESPIVVKFELNGIEFMGLNGGAQFKFSEAISYVVECDSQEEIDFYWTKLTQGGSEGICGWVKDKFGMSWQIVPTVIGKLMSDPVKGPRVMLVLQKMKKLNIQELENA